MSPVLPAFILTLALGLAGWGVLLLRSPVTGALLGSGQERDAGPRRGNRDPLEPLLRLLGARLAPLVLSSLGEERRRRARARIDAAGRPDGMNLEVYAGRKGAWTAILTAVGVALALAGFLLAPLVLAILGWFFVDLLLSAAGRRRQAQLDRDFPDFLDVLSVTVTAGVAFRPALGRVATTVGGPVGEEIGTTLAEMDLGADRRSAFEALRTRNESDFVGRFVAALLQAEELGAPLAEALTEQASDMRQAAGQRARQLAQQAAPRISVIVIFSIVPGSVILIITALLIGSDIGASLGG